MSSRRDPLRDLRERRLKDFERPERVFQLVVEGLREDYPPLATEHISRELEAFSGREDELVEAAAAAVAQPTGRRRLRPAGIAWAVAIVAIILGATIVAVVAATRGSDASDTSGLVPPKSIAVIDPAQNAVSESIPLGGTPSLLAGDRRDLWIANVADKTLLRVDAETRRLVKTIGLGATPNGIATGAGAVWITSDGFGSSPASRTHARDERSEGRSAAAVL
jgi:hypothetical protein